MAASLFRSIDPATGEVGRAFGLSSPADVEQAIERATASHQTLKSLALQERATYLESLGEKLENQAEALGRLITLEMGKPLPEAIGEIKKCAMACRYFAEHGPALLSPQTLQYPDIQASIRKDPLGLVLAIMPWNFPFWQVFRFGAPAILAGNTIILKHAPNVPQCARAIHQLAAEVMPGLIENVFVNTDTVAELIARPEIRAVTLTGSTGAGRAVAALAGRALKKTVLELGGSDPAIVLDDCNLPEAVDQISQSRLRNAGQSCIATKRILVHHSIAAQFAQLFKEVLTGYTIGPGISPGVDMGPLARADLRDNFVNQVNKSIADGATEFYRHALPDDLPTEGFFSSPVILYPCPAHVPAWQEETFGPLVAIQTFETDEQAVARANDTLYGLGASIYTQNTHRAQSLAGQLDTGNVFINGLVKSDPRLPFGGVKDSGYGRELGSYGIHEFVNIKTVAI